MDILCPTEDAVSALLDCLVEPKLPAKASAKVIPPQADQESVAKQVRAVALLYNYYYRKQHPTLEYLDFEDFLKLAAVLKPPLRAYLCLLQRSNDIEPPQLSPTEQQTMDACEIAKSLDRWTGEWPVSKVAILLVNSKKESCFLQFGPSTEGVWSVIEKDVTVSDKNSKSAVDTNKKRKYARKNSYGKSDSDEAGFHQLAFSAVNDATGINQSDLVVLESHFAYSLSKPKTTARFYIMQCTQPSYDHVMKASLENVIESLRGPLLVKSSCWWSTTSVVEYFHLLPYIETISDWFSSKGLPNKLVVQKVEMDVLDTNGSKSIETPFEQEVSNKLDKPHPPDIVIELPDSNSSGSSGQNENDSYCMATTSNDYGHCNMEVDGSSLIHSKRKEKNRDTYAGDQLEINRNATASEAPSLKGRSSGANLKAAVDNSLTSQADPACSGENVFSGNKICNDGSSSQDRNFITPDAQVAVKSSTKVLDKLSTIIASKDKELSQAALGVILSRRDKLSFQLREIEDQIAQCDKDILTIMNGGEDNLALKVESIIECCSDICSKRHTQRVYPYGEGQCTLQCGKKAKSPDTTPDTTPSIQNHCQELDGICIAKNWILPTYHLSALDGGFEATVHVKGTDSEWSSGSELLPRPREARESAAAHMLVQLSGLPQT